jgi:cytoskeletal protein CcmA (bactofilin family)
MTDSPSSGEKKATNEPPAPEVLRSQSDGEPEPSSGNTPTKPSILKRPRRGSYRPSHKATFIGLGVVVVILAVNAVIISFVMNAQTKSSTSASGSEVTISPAVLDTLGVSRNTIGSLGTELVVGPDSQFKGKVTVGGDVSIAGQLKLNSKFTATDASLANLEAGNTSVSQLNVNGDGTISTLNLRKDLNVVGSTRLQGPVTVSQLFTVENNVNVSGSLAVGGTLSTRNFEAVSLVSDTTLTIGGHVITRGSAPGISPGSALGSNGTVSISGNDASGTIAANIGTGAISGIVAYVSFRAPYGSTPHVVVSAIGGGIGSFYVNRNANGFSVGVNGAMSPGGYAFDYIVMQ